VINQRIKPRLRRREKNNELIPLSLNQQTAVTRLALALGESTDLNALYRIIFEHVSEIMDTSTFIVSAYNAEEGLIQAKYAICDGIETNVSKFPSIPLGKKDHGTQSQVIRSGKPLLVKDYQKDSQSIQPVFTLLENGAGVVQGSPPLKSEDGIRSIVLAPLRVSGKTIGVIQVQSQKIDAFVQQDVDLLTTLANVAAAAIQNATLYETLQSMNVDLSLSYDSTLEGWARALELRDFETTGHSVRVTDMSLILAMYMGIRGQALVNIRRGALLHDVGKMGISDDILLKPGPLTPEEWDIMRKHPLFGFRMLEPIEFLRPAMDIVLYHHEKWNGTGYPAALRGELIPLAARVFAIVDVWDSLIHARPYKRAWTEQEARDYIRDQSGTHFDPAVLEKFLPIVN
jgi:HD-GYP domain-containing protein (c-di-GMP phosphodiesterase class II)